MKSLARDRWVVAVFVMWTIVVRSSGAVEIEGLRLADGAMDTEGRVEIFVNDAWLSVCDGNWSYIEATVVCRHLTRGVFGVPIDGGKYGRESRDSVTGEIDCDGSEKLLSGCDSSNLVATASKHCGEAKLAGVLCNPEIRLSGMIGPREGAVEISSQEHELTITIRETSLLDQDSVNNICREIVGLGSYGKLTSVSEEESGDYSLFESSDDIPTEENTSETPRISCVGEPDPCEMVSCLPNSECVAHMLNTTHHRCVCKSGFSGIACAKETEEDVERGPVGPPILHIFVVLVLLTYGIALVVLFVLYKRVHDVLMARGSYSPHKNEMTPTSRPVTMDMPLYEIADVSTGPAKVNDYSKGAPASPSQHYTNTKF